LQSQASYYLGQKVRFYAKVEVMDDILTGMMENLLENGSVDKSQKVHERF
jgi:delta 1-pyrroline-5-carboxylate dehydrogenase